MPYLAQLTPFSTPAARPQQTQASDLKNNDLKNNDRKSDAGTSDTGHKVLESGAKIAARTWADALALTSTTAASVPATIFRNTRSGRRFVQRKRGPHTRRACWTWNSAEQTPQQRAAELEAARELAAARLVELVRQREPGLHESNPPAQSFREESLAGQSMSARSTIWEDLQGKDRWAEVHRETANERRGR